MVLSFCILSSKFWSELIRVKDFLDRYFSFILCANINLLKFSAKFITFLDDYVFKVMNFEPLLFRFLLLFISFILTLCVFFGADVS